MQQSPHNTASTPALAKRFGAPLGFLVIFSCIWITFTGLATTLLIKNILAQSDAAARFIPVPATITTSKIKTHDGDDGTTYSNAVTYSYTHNNQPFTSSRIAHDTMSGSYKSAKAWARAHPVGSPITAYIDPQSPGSAVLRTAVGRGSWMLLLFLLPFQSVAIGALALVAAAIRERFSPPSARHPLAPLFVYDSPDRTTLRLETAAPFMAAVATTGLLSFISIFIVAFTTGMSPHPAVSITTAAACITLGILAGFSRLWSIHRGSTNLTIDRAHRLLFLPPTAKSENPSLDLTTPIPLATIHSILTRPTLPAAAAPSSDAPATHLYTLELRIGSIPSISTITLNHTLPADRAHALAAYLRAACGIPEADFASPQTTPGPTPLPAAA